MLGLGKMTNGVKIHAPRVVAYHDSNPEFYLAPNLRRCTLTKDIHHFCLTKPFVCDNNGGICGLKPMPRNTQCPATVTPRHQVVETQAEIVGNRWLLNTPAKFGTLTYDWHDTSTRIELSENIGLMCHKEPSFTLEIGLSIICTLTSITVT